MQKVFLVLAGAASLFMTVQTFAAGFSVSVIETEDQRCITSDGLPEHEAGGGAHGAQAIAQTFCLPRDPVKSHRPSESAAIIGILLNGVIVRPSTAEFYDPSAPRGFSRNRSSGWRLDALGNPEIFRVDANSGHADRRGLYHYHGMPAALIPTGQDTMIGYAADGHEIHYAGEQARSSYVLKSGLRPSGPGGPYDGTYDEDYAYVAGAGNLDECNGAMVDGAYIYFATDTYPYFQRCHFGKVSDDFVQKGPRGGNRPTRVGRP
ncbi:MAG: YHYH protein [Pseudomonadota bacterium]